MNTAELSDRTAHIAGLADRRGRNARVTIGHPTQIDAEGPGWLKQDYAAA